MSADAVSSERDEGLLAPACWGMIGIVAILLAFAAVRVGFHFEWRSAGRTILACLLLGSAIWFYRCRRPDERIAVSLSCVVQLTLFTSLAAPLSYIIAATGGPFWDETLHAWDRALGLDWLAYLAFVNDRPWLGTCLRLAYLSLVPQTVIIAVALGLTGHLAQCRAFVAAFMISALISMAASAVMPAVAMFVHLSLQPQDYSNLNPAAAFVHMSQLTALRDGTLRSISLDSIEGLITFPSYHAALAVIFAHALWTVPSLRWPGLALNVAMLAGTPIDGGHYFVDVIAGVMVAVVSLVAVRALRLHRFAGLLRLREGHAAMKAVGMARPTEG